MKEIKMEREILIDQQQQNFRNKKLQELEKDRIKTSIQTSRYKEASKGRHMSLVNEEMK